MKVPTPVTTQNPVIKEIDAWQFTFCPDDNTIAISTPALQSFKLKLSLTDLEELLEFMYRRTGQEKTTRRLQFNPADIPELIEKVSRMIEEKKSKIPVALDTGEIEEIAALMNEKIKM